ncbi:hypothetical protein [Rhodobacter capsulatus]|uniref:hypothetical protein n=1 Tax=Rhodobacter capsulatus TaxID=1061 RepID=UPI0003D32E2C|nr:hypothetical protein [Rhodobacter capsulatus]ETD81596.1 hypothetical protein U716_10510 [Rhodobacter capsulatus B6]
MSPAPLFWITVLGLLAGLLGLSVAGWRHAKPVQQIVLGLAGLSGIMLTLSFLFAPLGLPVAACALVTYVACRLVAGLASRAARLVAAPLAFGLIAAPFAERISFEIRTASARGAYARGWADLARKPLAVQFGTLRLQLPFSPQIHVATSCPPGAAAAPGVCVITALDARPQAHDLLQGGPPPAAPGQPARLDRITLDATDPAGRFGVVPVSSLETAPPESRAQWCARHPEALVSPWCAAPLSRSVTLRPAPREPDIEEILLRDHLPLEGITLPPDATGTPARFTCSATRDAARRNDPTRIRFRLCRLSYQPLAGLEAVAEFDGIADADLSAAALRLTGELRPYIAALKAQP